MLYNPHTLTGSTYQQFSCTQKRWWAGLILNLINLNEKVRRQHFKMQTFTSAVTLVTKDCYMAAIDWTDAYYSVPGLEEHQKYLKFQWRRKLFQYTCLSNGLLSAACIFTNNQAHTFISYGKRSPKLCIHF